MTKKPIFDIFYLRISKSDEKFLNYMGKTSGNKPILILWTPGVDSFLSEWLLKKNKVRHKKVYFNLNSTYSRAEMLFIKHCYKSKKDYKIIDNFINIRNIENKNFYVPNRNLLLVTLASALFDVSTILLNGVKDDRVSDNNKDFYKKSSITLSTSLNKKIMIKSLLINREKAQWIREYYREYYNENKKIDIITKTYSCFSKKLIKRTVKIYKKKKNCENFYESTEKINIFGCLKCRACFRKFSAVTNIGFFINFLNLELAKNYLNSVDNKKSPHRYKSIKEYLHFLNNINKLSHPNRMG